MAYGDLKELPRRTASDKELRDKAYNIVTYPNYDGNQCGLAPIVYKCLHKKPSCGAIKSELMSKQQLTDELHKPIIRKFEKRKVYLSFKDNI